MTRLPFWKLKREARRLYEQIAQVNWLLVGRSRRQAYDRDRARLVTTIAGQKPLTDKVAILLILQPAGVLLSFLEELRHFHASGFACIVVSNAALSKSDQELLLPLCHLVVQRPNYGYDFGGYREGILTLKERGIRPRYLVVKNDSIWFPIKRDCDFLNKALAAPVDLFGVYFNREARIPHLQSYFYGFGPAVLNDPRFWDYWQNLWMTNNKHMVVRQCEMKLTRHFERMGFTSDALFDAGDLRDGLTALDDEYLRAVLEYQLAANTRSDPRVRALSGQKPGPDWRKEVEALIHSDLIGKHFLLAHPAVLLHILRCPVLKKTRGPVHALQREELFRLGMDKLLRPIMSAEILQWDRPKP